MYFRIGQQSQSGSPLLRIVCCISQQQEEIFSHSHNIAFSKARSVVVNFKMQCGGALSNTELKMKTICYGAAFRYGKMRFTCG
jgi:hypothetical protein